MNFVLKSKSSRTQRRILGVNRQGSVLKKTTDLLHLCAKWDFLLRGGNFQNDIAMENGISTRTSTLAYLAHS